MKPSKQERAADRLFRRADAAQPAGYRLGSQRARILTREISVLKRIFAFYWHKLHISLKATQMMVKIKSLLFAALVLCLAATSVYAQSPESILDQARKNINSFGDLTVEFKKTMKMVEGQTQSYEGKLVMKKKMYIVHLGDIDIYSDGRTVWTVNKSDREVNISNVDPEESLTPDRIFNISREQMRTRLDGTETVNGHVCHKISLFPQQAQDYVSITVWVDKAKNLPRQVTQKLRNGTQVTYSMSSIISDRGIEDGVFRLNPAQQYPGYHVEDLR